MPALDPVTNQVLQMIAQQQRDMHAENKGLNQQTFDAVNEVKEEMHTVKTAMALYAKDMALYQVWKDTIVDPFIMSAKEGVAQARGGLRGFKLAATLFSTGALFSSPMWLGKIAALGRVLFP